MSHISLHYIYDPFCAHCFGIAPLVEGAMAVPGLPVIRHIGTAIMRPRAGRNLRELESAHLDELHFLERAGQPVGDTYRKRAHLSEGPSNNLACHPAVAMLAADLIDRSGWRMLRRLQAAYFVEGLPIDQRPVLLRLAVDQGFNIKEFDAALVQAQADLPRHMCATRNLVHRLKGQGLPSLSAEVGNHAFKLDLTRFVGKPQMFRHAIQGLIATA
ncbi:DsbA family protein [Variovorax sp. OV329]|uniref:DsbA family protein n=1 Tax=Variovorax sp. OV329 TaxID=1882825 RepID=UPI0008E730F9|nr:hypothetical protein [Variovorax sp. OV329]SFN21820.1 putative protein-disulfide isomerase [Variovorax sp. OV329]